VAPQGGYRSIGINDAGAKIKSRMKVNKDAKSILVIPEIIPFPPHDGGKLCIFGLIDYLRKFHRIHILLLSHNLQDKNDIQSLIAEWPDVIIDFVDLYREERALSVTSKTIKLIKNSIINFYHVLRTSNNNYNSGIDYSRYNAAHSTPFYPHSEIFIKKLTAILAEKKFDIIQTELVRTLNLVNLFPDDAKKIFVQIEGRGDVLYDYGMSNGFNHEYINHVAGNAAFLEYAYMRQYDAILALNESDELKIRQNVPSTVKVYTSPFGILDADIKKTDIDSFEAENLIFIGSENHYPNVDALNWFLTDIVAEIKNRPFKKLYVTGSWSEKTIERYRKLLDCIDFIGFVDDLTPYLKNSVSIVPIRIGGGGIRTKILFAMAHGSPVVATSLAAVGINGGHEKELLIADAITDFVNGINRFFNDNQFARTIGQNAYQLIIDKYSQSKVGAIRNNIYKEICNTPANKQNE
jgi:glycosyltransferase involved in cell wall biosynthesis